MNKAHTRSIIYILVFVSMVLFYKFGRSLWVPVYLKITGKESKTIDDLILDYRKSINSRVNRSGASAGMVWPT